MRVFGSTVRLATIVGPLLMIGAAAEVVASEPAFVDRRAAAGIDFKHHAGKTDEKYLIETMGGGVALLDYDGDDLLDIYFVNGGTITVGPDGRPTVGRSRPRDQNRLYRNNGDGTFLDVAERAGVTGAAHGYGMGAAVGDYDGDGRVDLYVTNVGANALYRNRGDGTFEDATATAGVGGGGWSASAGFFDYDGDGDLDLFVARYLDWDFDKHVRCGEPFRTYCPPGRHRPTTNLLYRNDGDGTFSDVSDASGVSAASGKTLGVAFDDFDGNGRLDVVAANDSVAQMLFRNRGDGTFEEVALLAGLAYDEDGGVYSGMGVDFEDYDNDGLPDVVVTNLAKEVFASYRNRGGGILDYVSRRNNLAAVTARSSGWGVGLRDFDLDGWKDLFVARSHVLDNVERIDPKLSYREPPLLARNVEGDFRDVSSASGAPFQEPLAARGAVFGDLDDDGDVDVVVSVLNDHPRILYNDASEGPNHWLIVRVTGRGGEGALVELTSKKRGNQRRRATAAGSYLSANDSRAHFGLGPDAASVSITVRRTDGAEQSFFEVRPDRILVVEELNSP